MTVDIIIPTYQPDERFLSLIGRLIRQTVKPDRIIIMNTDRDLWDKSHAEDRLIETGAFSLCEIYHTDKASFDHGGTRNRGVSLSHAPYFICMTQDAVPQNDLLIENLLAPMNGRIKMTYARQLPDRNAGPVERFSRYYNYPEVSRVKTQEDVKTLGIKTYFASNVCAAYERETFDRLGGFINRTIFNEDMIYAGKLLQSGMALKYCAGAAVYHSHNYSAGMQFHRNFDLAVSQADHPEIFAAVKSESEGIRMVKETSEWLKKQGMRRAIPGLIRVSACKYAGYWLGKHYRLLPRSLVKHLSMNKQYWEKKDE